MCLSYTWKSKNSEWTSHPETCCGLAERPGNGQVDPSGCWSPFPEGLTWSFSCDKILGYVFVIPALGFSSGFSPWPLNELDQKLHQLQSGGGFSTGLISVMWVAPVKLEGYLKANLHMEISSSGLPLQGVNCASFFLGWGWEQMPHHVWVPSRTADHTWEQWCFSAGVLWSISLCLGLEVLLEANEAYTPKCSSHPIEQNLVF